MEAPQFLGNNHNYTDLHGSRSEDPALIRRPKNSDSHLREPLSPEAPLDDTTEVGETFYSEAGGPDFFDTTLFPRIRI
jgi:hypothetical protein